MTTHDDVRTWSVAAVGGVTALIVFVIVLALQVLYYHADARLAAALEGPGSPPELAAFVSHEEGLLKNGYSWADPKTKKKVLLPISRAMELTVAAIQADPKAACPWGVVVAPAAGTPAAKPAAAAQPAGKAPVDKKAPADRKTPQVKSTGSQKKS